MRDRRRPGRTSRRAAGIRALGAAAVLALTASACGYVVQTHNIDQARTAAGQPTLPVSTVLNSAAGEHSAAMCAAHAVNASPATAYHQETAVDVHELVGSAPLDPSIAQEAAREAAAAQAIWSSWKSDAALVAAKWTDMGVAQQICDDDQLYMTAVLRQTPSTPATMPATGLYSTPQYFDNTVVSYLGIQYTTAVDYRGVTIPLLLDIYTPPSSAPSPRPTVVLVHGGAFVGGSRTDEANGAIQWANRGYNAVAIDYRMDPRLNDDASLPKVIAAATNATTDAERAVRFIKANAATYGIDVNRIAAIGGSAGGAITLGMSALPDGEVNPPNAEFSSKVAVSISSGAYLTPGIDYGVLHITAGLAPILMFHYETDVASNTGPYAFRTCQAYRDAGSTCDYVSQPGEGHTVDLTAGHSFWTSKVGPFLWQNLHLAGLPLTGGP
jgi:dienelactone hydrolase